MSFLVCNKCVANPTAPPMPPDMGAEPACPSARSGCPPCAGEANARLWASPMRSNTWHGHTCVAEHKVPPAENGNGKAHDVK